MSSVEKQVGLELIKRKQTVAVAESCTGGMVAEHLTRWPGSSQYFILGWVTYANEQKIASLGVQSLTLERWGAVSEQCAQEMALGACQKAGTTWALSTTGIAGPTGDTSEKPIGLVYGSIAYNKKVQVKKWHFHGSRKSIRQQSTLFLLGWFYDILTSTTNF